MPLGYLHRRSIVRALLVFGAGGGCSKPIPTATPAVPVSVALARREAVPYLVGADGRVEPLEMARVTAQVSGLIFEVAFAEGDAVRQGQILFRIEPRPYAAALAQARAALARDGAQAANARLGLDRLRALRPDDYVTQSQVDSQATTVTAGAATLSSDSAAVIRAQFDLDNTVIRAPISGRTGGLLVQRGNLVAADPSQPLVVINRIDPILVRFTVPETVLPDVQRARATGAVQVRVRPADAGDSFGDSPSEGRLPGDPVGTLSFIDNAVDTTTGTVQLKAQVLNPGGGLWPGQFVRVTLQLGVQPDAIVIPTRATQTGQQGAYLFVVQPDGRAALRSVSLGRNSGPGTVVVARGLAAGDRVVTDGQSQLSDGALVRVTSVDSTGATARSSIGVAR